MSAGGLERLGDGVVWIVKPTVPGRSRIASLTASLTATKGAATAREPVGRTAGMMVRRSGRMWGMVERSMASPMAEGQASGSLGDYGRTVRHDGCQTLIHIIITMMAGRQGRRCAWAVR
jgi:hypothetical protein